MKSIKDYIRSVSFSLGYSFKFVFKETIIVFLLFIFAGFLPYGSSFLLGKLVNTVVSGVKSSQVDIWQVLILYAIVSALPTIISNLQVYVNRFRMLKFQVEMELFFLKKRESIDIATYEDPKF